MNAAAPRSESLILVPAFDEEKSLGPLLRELREHAPGLDVLVVNDGSADGTAAVALAGGARVLNLPCNLGVGGAVQAGFRYAHARGYRTVVRCDGDGQHPPAQIPRLLDALKRQGTDLVIGSRFLDGKPYTSTRLRHCGIRVLARFLSIICRKRVTDPTSGFQAVTGPLLRFFSQSYPCDYPEPEALALMRRQGYDFAEVPAGFRERTAGASTIQGWGTLYYVFKVFLALCVDRARRVDARYARSSLAEAP
ncbi:MAG: glycosyltransferase family 2 protein [Lentisphaerae bacterium]|nr:glycosyltransferase family 2 protein [Lentisphaerota bacterium]